MDRQHGWSPPERPKARRTCTADAARRRDEACTASSLPTQVFAAQVPGVERHITGALGDVLIREMARGEVAAPPPGAARAAPSGARNPVPATELAALVERIRGEARPQQAPSLEEPDVTAELTWVLVDVAGQSQGRSRQVASLQLSDLIGDPAALQGLGPAVLRDLVASLDAADPRRVGNHMLLRVLRIAALRQLAVAEREDA